MSAKLTTGDIRKIRQLDRERDYHLERAEQLRRQNIAKMFGISYVHTIQICKYRIHDNILD